MVQKRCRARQPNRRVKLKGRANGSQCDVPKDDIVRQRTRELGKDSDDEGKKETCICTIACLFEMSSEYSIWQSTSMSYILWFGDLSASSLSSMIPG